MKAKTWHKLSLIETLAIITVLSLCFLPIFMLYSEYLKGSFELDTFYRVQNILEDKIEKACAIDYDSIPVGTTTDSVIVGKNGLKLDLNPSVIDKYRVNFKLKVESLPLEFTWVTNGSGARTQRTQLFESYKRVEIFASWGENNKLNLLAYKGNL